MKVAWHLWIAAIPLGSGWVPAHAADHSLVERVAAWTDPDFREDRRRLREIEAELAGLPELVARPFAWRYGFRSKTGLDPSEPHWLQIDLGKSQRIDRLVAMPAHIPPLGPQGIGYGFPVRFKIEVGNDPDMRDAITVVDQTAADFPNPGRFPADFRIDPVTGRHVRFTSTRHYPIDEGFIWAIEELLVLSGNRSLANWQPVKTSSSLEMFPNWSASRSQDGQSSLGLPVSREPSPNRGYLSSITPDPNETKWLKMDFGEELPIDEIRLVPVQSEGYEVPGERSFSRSWTVELAEDPGFERIVWKLHSPVSNLIGYPGDCAVALPCGGVRARHLRFLSLQQWSTDDRCGYGLAEIQAYSGDRNVALGREVAASDATVDDPRWSPDHLTDGFSSRHRLIEIPEHLELIARRGRLETERERLAERCRRTMERTGTAMNYGGGGLGLAGLLGCAFLLVRQKRTRRREVARLRDQIARDLHDDIGSNLGGIVLVSELGSKQSTDPQSRADFLAIKEAADGASASMRDIVWLIQSGQHGLRDMVMRMRQVARMIGGEAGLVVEVEPPDFEDRELSLLFRRHVFFAFKEALNNVRKHAAASNIGVRIQITGARMTFIVRDDGKGFDPGTAEQPGHGLGNLRRRAARVKGSCLIESRPGSGSTVTFSAPLGA